MKKRIPKNVSVVLLMLSVVGFTVLVSHAAELTHNTATELTEKKANGGMVDIVCSMIESGGVIIAAIIGVGGLRKITKEGFDTYFTSFSSENHDLKRIIKRAKIEITIIVAYGDNLLKEYTSLLCKCMRQGIKVNYLMLDKEHAWQMAKDYYNEVDEKLNNDINISLNYLEKLRHYDNFEIKTWSYPLSASYIAIDCGIAGQKPQKNALIQIMVYQYNVPTPEAPITYLSYKKNKDVFERTIGSLKEMWSNANTFERGSYN